MKATKNLLVAIVAMLSAMFSYGQIPSEPIKIGGRTVKADGTIECATNISLLTTPVVNEINMGMRSIERQGNTKYYVVIAVPYREINIGSDGSLVLTTQDGKVMNLPVQKQMKWNQDRILVGSGDKTAYVMRIPFEITESQKDELIAGVVTNVKIIGADRNIDFKTKKFSNILKRQFGELSSYVNENSGAIANNDNASIERQKLGRVLDQPTVTSQTKYFSVSNWRKIDLGECANGYFSIVENDSHKCFIFTSDGQNVGELLLPVPFVKPLHFDKSGVAIGVAIGPDSTPTKALIDKTGKVIRYFDFYMSVSDPVDGLITVFENVVDGYGHLEMVKKTYIDINGDAVFNDLAYNLETNGIVMPDLVTYPLTDGLRLFEKDGKYGYIDAAGAIIISPKYEDGQPFSEGLAAVAIKDGAKELWGYVDVTGNYVIPPKFGKEPTSFSSGCAIAQKTDGYYVYIDRKGECISPEYNEASPFYYGLAIVHKQINMGGMIINKEFKKCLEMEFPKQVSTDAPVILCNDGLYSVNGDRILRCEFGTTIGEFKDIITYYSGNQKGYINAAGEYVVQFIDSGF